VKRIERYAAVLSRFEQQMPEVTTELTFGNRFQLLVAVMLSAQCTDKRINQVTPELFSHYPTAASMAQAREEDVLALIRSVSYPNSKARHLVATARMLVDEFGGEVPDEMEQLTRLPGVGRKTANVVQAVGFGRPAIAVDTHVFRVSRRLALVPSTANTPLKVEQALTAHIDAALRSKAHHWLLLHGRYVCTSRAPKCEKCFLADVCPSAGKFKSAKKHSI